MVVASVVAALIGAGGAALALGEASPVNTADKAAIEKIVREYIVENPEILTEAMANLEKREAAKVIAANRKAIETPFGSAWEGAANGDVTLVQFFDYACGYCRASLPAIERLLSEDKQLKVVYRELPVLGQSSLDAARVSLAVAQGGGDYGKFHRALYGGGKVSSGSIEAARKSVGAPAARDATAIDAELSSNMTLQQELSLTGTPSWVVGDRLLNGAVGYERLKEAIAEARAR